MKVLVIGEINLDCVSEITDGKLKGVFTVGGKGYNIASNLKYFNFQVDFLTALGKDGLGKYFLKKCRENNIKIIYSYLNRNSNCCVGLYEKGELTYEHFHRLETWRLSKLPDRNYDKVIITVDLDEISVRRVLNKYRNSEVYLSIASIKGGANFFKYLNGFKLIFCNYAEAKSFVKGKKPGRIEKLFEKLGEINKW